MSQITVRGLPAAALKRLDELGGSRDEQAAAALLAGLDRLEADAEQELVPEVETKLFEPPRRRRKESNR